MYILGVIPARGGSKGVPKKNIRLLGGKPLIAYSVERAGKSKLLNRTVVSTDCPEIAETARQYGADVPFMRPAEYAQDFSKIVDVLQHAVNWVEKEGGAKKVDWIVCMQPTTPFGTSEDIDRAIQLVLDNPQCDSLMSLRRSVNTPYYMKKIVNGFAVPIMPDDNPEKLLQNRQEAPKTYEPNGLVTVTSRDVLMQRNARLGLKILPMIMEDEDVSVNIDREIDFLLAEDIIKKRNSFFNFKESYK